VRDDGGVRERLRGVRGFVFDMDGTLVLGDRRNHALAPLPGALEIIRWAAGRELPFVILTNGTTRTPGQYAALLREIGFGVGDEAVMTPASSAVAAFARRRYRRVMVLGGDGLAGPLREAGIEALPPAGREPGVDAVLAGWYPEFTMGALEAACEAVWAGAALYSCSQSVFFATAGGRALGTSRAISSMITSLTGRRVRVVGKPSLAALRAAARRLGTSTAELAVVGDDPDLEVPMARRGHALAVAVGTGLAGPGSFDGRPPALRPHLLLRGVDELLALCQRADGPSAAAGPAGGPALSPAGGSALRLLGEGEAGRALLVHLRVQHLVVQVGGCLRLKEHPGPVVLENLVVLCGALRRCHLQRARVIGGRRRGGGDPQPRALGGLRRGGDGLDDLDGRRGQDQHDVVLLPVRRLAQSPELSLPRLPGKIPRADARARALSWPSRVRSRMYSRSMPDSAASTVNTIPDGSWEPASSPARNSRPIRLHAAARPAPPARCRGRAACARARRA
jgi:4-nitrophenyl phosphatase